MILNLLRENIKTLKPYSSARDEFGGNASVWLDANESPTALPDLPIGINRYPASQLKELKQRISELKGVNIEQVFVGNGSDEAVDLLFRIFCNPSKDKVLVFPPTYGMYGVCAAVNDVQVIESPMDENFNIDLNGFGKVNVQNSKLTFICNPNNPSANTQKEETIRYIIENSNGIVVVDEGVGVVLGDLSGAIAAGVVRVVGAGEVDREGLRDRGVNHAIGQADGKAVGSAAAFERFHLGGVRHVQIGRASCRERV